MPIVYFVRHGEAAAGFGAHRDPQLSSRGVLQAEETAKKLASMKPIPLISSPLRRAQETADALAKLWKSSVTIEARIAEIPSPIEDLTDRTTWLAKVMAGSWSDLPPDLQIWRQALLDCVVSVPSDCVMFSHFVAINLLVGAANDNPAMVSFRPGNASITKFESDGSRLTVLELGDEASTHVN